MGEYKFGLTLMLFFLILEFGVIIFLAMQVERLQSRLRRTTESPKTGTSDPHQGDQEHTPPTRDPPEPPGSQLGK